MEIDGKLVSSLGANQCVEMLGHGDQWLSKHTKPAHTASEIRSQLVHQYSSANKRSKEAPPAASRVHKSPSQSTPTVDKLAVLEEYKQAVDEHQSKLASLEQKLKQATISKPTLLQKSIAKATT